MELKEYLQIIKKHLNLFIATILVTVAGVLAYFLFRPVSWSTSLTLNITRAGSQETPDYKFDDFYRLQADEKFAETVVEWIKSPRVEEDIFKNAGINTSDYTLGSLSKSVRAEKRSSQIVAVSFSAPSQKVSENIAKAVSQIISQNTDNLNRDQKDNTWFEIIFGDPVIKADRMNPLAIPFALLAGIFLGFWVVMVKHYME